MPTLSQTLYRCFALALGVPMHLLLMLAISESVARGVPPESLRGVDLTFLAAYTGLGVIAAAGYAFRTRASSGLAVAAAVCMLPKYIWAFPLNWPLSLTGILLCLGLGRYLLRSVLAQEKTTARRRRHEESGAGGEFENLDLFLCVCAAMVLVVMLLCGYGMVASGLGLAAVWTVVVLGIGLSLVVEFECCRPSWRKGPYVEHGLLILGLLFALSPARTQAVLPVLALRQIVVGVRIGMRERGGRELWGHLLNRPAQLLVYSFALVIALGTVLLTLPVSTWTHQLTIIDALFTATSAVCVTGLTSVDTGTTFSYFGQVVILGLIQVGGLGIMTISTFIALVLGQNIGLKSEFAVQEMVGEQRSRSALRLIQFIIISTLTIEAVGAVLVALEFWCSGVSPGRALYLGGFHSVSAFCNAGFSMFPRNLEGLGGLTLVIISVLIILGGLGFSVQLALVNRWFKRQPLGLHAKLVVWMTVLLLAGGTVLIWALERNGALRACSPAQGWVHAWFLSVSSRTAGFNSLDMISFGPSALLVVVVLMFIGAAPGSTGGGIKVTTTAVLAMVTAAVFTGRSQAIFAGRRLAIRTVYNAVALVALSLAAIVLIMVMLVATQDISPGMLLFEAVSAFGTVGLSLGATAKLTVFGKLCIILLMFIGRVGTLTLLIMVRPKMRHSSCDYPLADVMIG